MVGKNNQEILNKKTGQRVNRYGIRRLSVGVASVAVAGLLFASNAALVQAADGVEDPTTIETIEAGTDAGNETDGTATEGEEASDAPKAPEADPEKELVGENEKKDAETTSGITTFAAPVAGAVGDESEETKPTGTKKIEIITHLNKERSGASAKGLKATMIIEKDGFEYLIDGDTTGLPAGEYTVKSITAPTGYIAVGDSKYLKEGQTITLREDYSAWNQFFINLTEEAPGEEEKQEEKPEEELNQVVVYTLVWEELTYDVAAKITLISGNEEYEIINPSTFVPKGKYTVKINAPEGYKVSDLTSTQGFELAHDGDEVEVNDTLPLYVDLTEETKPVGEYKVDFHSHVFESRESNEFTVETPKTTLTDKDGNVYTEDEYEALPAGEYKVNVELKDGYELVEGETNSGNPYLLDGATVRIPINDSDSKSKYSQYYFKFVKKEETKPVGEYKVDFHSHVFESRESNEFTVETPKTTLTDKDGNVYTEDEYEALPAGEYKVNVELKDGYELVEGETNSGNPYLLDGATVRIPINDSDSKSKYSQYYFKFVKKEETKPEEELEDYVLNIFKNGENTHTSTHEQVTYDDFWAYAQQVIRAEENDGWVYKQLDVDNKTYNVYLVKEEPVENPYYVFEVYKDGELTQTSEYGEIDYDTFWAGAQTTINGFVDDENLEYKHLDVENEEGTNRVVYKAYLVSKEDTDQPVGLEDYKLHIYHYSELFETKEFEQLTEEDFEAAVAAVIEQAIAEGWVEDTLVKDGNEYHLYLVKKDSEEDPTPEELNDYKLHIYHYSELVETKDYDQVTLEDFDAAVAAAIEQAIAEGWVEDILVKDGNEYHLYLVKEDSEEGPTPEDPKPEDPSDDGKEDPSDDGKDPSDDGKDPSDDGKDPSDDGKDPSDDGKDPSDEGKDPSDDDKKPSLADQIDITLPEKTGVKDINNLTEIEKEKVKIAITDANKLPKGTEVLVGSKGDVIINYPDGSHDVISREDLVYQLVDSDAGKPADPDKGGTPSKPGTGDASDSKGGDKGSSKDSKAKDSQDKLPQTGESSSAAILGLAGLSIMAGLGLVAGRRKEEN